MAVITIKNVNIESIKKGRNSYEQATVEYTDERGDSKSKKIVSFAAPAVFDTVKNAKPGETYNAKSVEKDGYWNWAELTAISKAAPAAKGGTYVDNRETPDERRMKQLMIVRQSSLSNAIEYAKYHTKEGVEPYTPGDIMDVAQQFVDFVYGTEEALATVDREDQDIPY